MPVNIEPRLLVEHQHWNARGKALIGAITGSINKTINPAKRLLAVQLDDQLFIDVLIDILSARLRHDFADKLIRIGNFEP